MKIQKSDKSKNLNKQQRDKERPDYLARVAHVAKLSFKVFDRKCIKILTPK